ncbi:hypothetical protein Leryth_019606 [Lithospermum erythrorhizon]|nr:hypothetical protein Leryth_019606 [Lithospermum erythrorhizon]
MGSFDRNAASLGVVLKLDYWNVSDIHTSLVNGTLESLDKNRKNGYFDKVSILGVNRRFYRYTLVEKAREENGFGKFDYLASESLGSDVLSIVNVIMMVRSVDLVYKSDCEKVSCDVFGGGEGGRKPRMLFHKIDSLGEEDENVRFLLRGWNGYRYRIPLMPSVMLISEGKWDKEKKRLDMVGCRILSGEQENGSVGDCSVRLSLRMPSKWTITERSAIVGEMWSSKRVNELGYFGSVELRSTSNSYGKDDGLTYEYTMIENVRKLCAERVLLKGKGGRYPSPLSLDMRFDMIVTNKKGDTIWGYSSPLTVGDTFFSQIQEPQESQIHDSMVNVSFVLALGSHNSMESTEISAEGLYNPNNGQVCMIGCKHGTPADWEPINNNSLVDCDILIHFQYAPLNSTSGTSTKGTIESTRKKSDPLYFQPLEISSHSIYGGQARESIWRMDVEITMVLISNTLACVFVGFQLFYVKRNPGILPSISIIMLLILTLGHMIPLLLNFEALFLANRNREEDLYLSTDGWLEVNEVLVRVITMIVFLLESRLLQITWSSRNDGSDERSLWPADKKVLYLSLPLYIVGGAIAWFAHLFPKSQQSPYIGLSGQEQQTLWGGLRAYGGLILDGFLLPQVLFNVLSESKEKALSPLFYVGTTILRLLPHIYDLYRSNGPTWSLSYIYANPRTGYYSTAWNIIISGGALVFVLLIFLQQKYGGRCFLPKKYRQSSMYEMVPAIGNESL